MRRAATLGDEIIRRGLNQEQTAVLGRVQPSTVQRIVAGQVRASPKTIVSLAKALGIGATRMQAMCEAHWLAAHPDEDLSGGIVTPPPRNAYGRPPRPGSRLREQITAITNRNEAFHGFADWLMFGGKLIGHNDPDYHEKVVKFNELIANCVIYSTACDITNAANQIAAEGEPVDLDDLATVSPYITHTVRRFGNWIINLTPPDQAPSTRLDLEPRVLFPTGPA